MTILEKIIPQFNKEKLKDVNMQPVGLANTRISTDYVQKPPQSLPFDHYGVILDTFVLDWRVI